jgi:hypothetical protein
VCCATGRADAYQGRQATPSLTADGRRMEEEGRMEMIMEKGEN